MRIIQLTPGAGGMYCGNCLRDNALVRELQELGHEGILLPFYLPLTLDENDQSQGQPIFFGGVNVYLEQKSALFRRAPHWLRHWLASPRLLRWAAHRAAKTRPEAVGSLTLSMLQGEDGNQARELEDLVEWLQPPPRPEAVCLSNVLLIGVARRLRQAVGCRIVCQLAGEDSFLDAMPAPESDQAWRIISQRAADVDLFLAPSRYYAELMRRRLSLPEAKVAVLPNGIRLDGYCPADQPPRPPAIGYFARMCQIKGLPTLVDAYLLLRRRNRVPDLRLRVGGGCQPSDRPLVRSLTRRLMAAGFGDQVSFHPNLDRPAKQSFLRSLSVFSVPTLYGEAFGLYLLEAMAAGVPVVQPDHAAFPELLAATGGGITYPPDGPEPLANAIEALLLNPEKARALGQAGRQAVERDFTARRMAEKFLAAVLALGV